MVIAAKTRTTPEINPAMIGMLSVEVDFVEFLSAVRKLIVEDVVSDEPGEVSKAFYWKRRWLQQPTS